MRFIDFVQNNLLFILATLAITAFLLYREWIQFQIKDQTISNAKLSNLMNEGATLIDLRVIDSFKEGHIPNAKNIQASELNAEHPTLKNANHSVILYDSTESESSKTLLKLKKQGIKNIYQLQGGFFGWLQDGMPVVNKKR